VKIGFKNFKHFLHTKIGREKCEKIVVVKDNEEKKLEFDFFSFFVSKKDKQV